MSESPETFDIEAWLTDANLPEESVTVYKRADVISELSDVKRRIEVEDHAAKGEQTAGNKVLRALEKRYAELLDTFNKSALTVYVRALTPDELRELREESKAASEGKTDSEQKTDFGYRLIAKSVVGIQPLKGKRVPASFTLSTVLGLAKTIGTAQTQLIHAAYNQVQNGLPVVDADFLLRRSGTNSDDTAG